MIPIATPRRASAGPSNPAAILQTNFLVSKVLLTAVEFGVLNLPTAASLASRPRQELGLHPRAIADFFGLLVAMKFLDRR